MRKTTIYALLIFSLLALACDSDCTDAQAEVESQYGTPDDINTFTQDGYVSEDWWYWSQGVEFTFEWGDGFDGCRKSKYTFEPIAMSSVSDSTRAHVEKIKLLKYSEINNDCYGVR